MQYLLAGGVHVETKLNESKPDFKLKIRIIFFYFYKNKACPKIFTTNKKNFKFKTHYIIIKSHILFEPFLGMLENLDLDSTLFYFKKNKRSTNSRK